jgi:hypothetical protein
LTIALLSFLMASTKSFYPAKARFEIDNVAC